LENCADPFTAFASPRPLFELGLGVNVCGGQPATGREERSTLEIAMSF
jgi:hypothetical protein